MLDFTLDFTLDSAASYPGAADASATRIPTARALADRRATATAKPAAVSSPRRRRYDALNTGRQTPLEW